MRKKDFNSKNCSKAINQFRIAIKGDKFTKDQLLNIFKESKTPTNRSFWAEFMKSGIIKKVSKKEFIFATQQPVFHGYLDEIYRRYSTICKNYRKPKIVSDTKTVYNTEEDCTLEVSKAIDLLKNLGYKILAPVATIYKSV